MRVGLEALVGDQTARLVTLRRAQRACHLRSRAHRRCFRDHHDMRAQAVPAAQCAFLAHLTRSAACCCATLPAHIVHSWTCLRAARSCTCFSDAKFSAAGLLIMIMSGAKVSILRHLLGVILNRDSILVVALLCRDCGFLDRESVSVVALHGRDGSFRCARNGRE